MQIKWKKMFHALHKVDMHACYDKTEDQFSLP